MSADIIPFSNGKAKIGVTIDEARGRIIINSIKNDIDTRLDAEGHVGGKLSEEDAITLVTCAYIEWMSRYLPPDGTLALVKAFSEAEMTAPSAGPGEAA